MGYISPLSAVSTEVTELLTVAVALASDACAHPNHNRCAFTNARKLANGVRCIPRCVCLQRDSVYEPSHSIILTCLGDFVGLHLPF